MDSFTKALADEFRNFKEESERRLKALEDDKAARDAQDSQSSAKKDAGTKPAS